jgi:hypothetical protein
MYLVITGFKPRPKTAVITYEVRGYDPDMYANDFVKEVQKSINGTPFAREGTVSISFEAEKILVVHELPY